ncbi:MAG: hypothetical protein LDL14_07125 [Nitrospira sp.]|nr:hypothetical protein [Nitrospira sp.]
MAVHPTGHMVFYRPDGRRFLTTDPAGHPLHECEWCSNDDGTVWLARARIRLDWGRWIGLVPGGLVNQTSLDLTRKPGWERLVPDDLRAMAARTLGVSIEEIRAFYDDKDLGIDARGIATIRHRKDALYVLDDGTFASARFMACMGAMHWDRIDFLPVVELFQSLLPGTGSAVFELIRGLYDDQNEGAKNPRPLRYRGIPTYPSKAAWLLFSRFFVPHAPMGTDAAAIFMDQARAHEITWTPAPAPPVRYFYDRPPLCLTMQGTSIEKATLADDESGLSYVNPAGHRFVPWDRTVTAQNGIIEIRDRQDRRQIAVGIPGVALSSSGNAPLPSPVDWRAVFQPVMPAIDPNTAFESVPLYPPDETPIEEVAAQPFVADYLQDLTEQDREIAKIVALADRILVDNGDAVIATCLPFDRPRDLVALVRRPAFAMKQAQRMWALCAELGRWDWLCRAKFCTEGEPVPVGWQAELAYVWLPYEDFEEPAALERSTALLLHRVRRGGHAFVTGPACYGVWLARAGLRILWEDAVEQLPTFAMHKTILPKAELYPGLTLFHVHF